MLVKDLKAALEKLDDDVEIVIKSKRYTWDCYEKVCSVLPETLYRNGGVYQEETYNDEPKYPVRVVVVK